jgi:hypothetical protein
MMTPREGNLLSILGILLNVYVATHGTGGIAWLNWIMVGLVTGVWLSAAFARNLKRNSAPIREVPAHGGHLITDHFRGELADGQKFLYCPVGNLVSWHPGDHDHRWCHWCQKGFEVFNRKDNQ